MGLTYHFAFQAPKAKSPEDLAVFLRSVEADAKKIGFEPTLVLNVVFDTTERKQFSRQLTTGLPVEDPRLKGAELPGGNRVWHLNSADGTCRVPPSSGVVLVVTNECNRWREQDTTVTVLKGAISGTDRSYGAFPASHP